MKTLLTIILIILPLLGNCQDGGIYQVTGPNLQPQLTQKQKTIDSLKTVLTAANKSANDCWANNYGLKADMKTKSDSLLLLKNQLKAANDTINKYKTLYLSGGIYKIKADSLTKAIDQCKNPTQLDSAQLAFYKNIPIDFVSPDNNTIFLTENVTVVPWFNTYTIIWRKNTDGTVTRYTMIYK